MAAASDIRKLLNKHIKKNDVEKVKALIDAHPILCSSDCGISKGDSPLHSAARFGLLEVVSVLLEHSAINSTNNDGKTALHEAATQGNLAVLKLLIEKGAEVDCLKAADW